MSADVKEKPAVPPRYGGLNGGRYGLAADFAPPPTDAGAGSKGKVVLQKKDGSEIKVPLAKLSDDDSEWVAKRGK